ncbi:MAG: tRNA pseudouridine(38-40) synthase TruA [Erysipelotrichia bacterium]|nr:tRNA pseudouridine(38-40) synthase TruA [Erysipelotrichia bacterium]
MKRYRCTVAYDGALYCGWQSQTRGNSIQEQIESALQELTGEKISILAAGRTDAGVSALGQVFHFDTEKEMEPRKWMGALNGYLPKDIHIMDVQDAGFLFHARFCVKAKQYDYRINFGPYDVFNRSSVYQCPFPTDIEKMKDAAEVFVGTHDFTSFNSTPLSKEPDQIRTIYSIQFHQEGNILTISYYGRGFLRYMVRMMTAALLEAGRGRLSKEQIAEMLEAADKNVPHHNAKPEGLVLVRVDYFKLLAQTDRMVIREFLPEDQMPQEMEPVRKSGSQKNVYPQVYAMAGRHDKVIYGWYAEAEDHTGELTALGNGESEDIEELRKQLEQKSFEQGGAGCTLKRHSAMRL